MMAERAAAALAPVADRLRRDAKDQADRIRAMARAEAAAILARAREQEAAIFAAARAAAAERSQPQTTLTLRRAHETARGAVLAAQCAAHDELAARIRAAVAALPNQPGYEQFDQRIARLAAQAAGPAAELRPEPGGGFVARAPGVVVDCSFDRLADLAMTILGPAVRELWTP